MTIFALIYFCCFILAVVSIFSIKNVEFSYSDRTCLSIITPLPDVVKYSYNSKISVNNSDFIKIGDFKLLSKNTCFNANESPSSGTYLFKASLFGGVIGKNIYRLSVPKPPTLKTTNTLNQPINIEKTFEINLSETDNIYEYQTVVNSNTVNCNVIKKSVSCDIKSAKLEKGKEYDLKIYRLFKNKIISKLADQKITTLSDIVLIDSSIKQNQIIYDNPSTITLDFNKEIDSAKIKLFRKTTQNDNYSPINNVEIDGSKITIKLLENLARKTKYSLSINQITGMDGSTSSNNQTVDFQMSGGPKYLESSIDTYGQPTSQTFSLKFDQKLSTSDNINNYLNISGASATSWIDNDKIYVKYATSSCSDVNIQIKTGIPSYYGINSDESWSFKTRTICRSISNFGSSVDGRNLTALTFGNGSTTILFIGSIHGNEQSARYLMENWINELERNYFDIPSGVKVVVIPTINPDGNAKNNRYNSNGIDLNRNFPSNDWQSDIYSLNNQLLSGAGGAAPLSEPESQAIANLTLSLRPQLTVTYHAAASYAIANQAGNSYDFAETYANLTGYRNMTGVEGGFSYPITGTYDDWLRDAYNLPSIIIELSSSTNPEFSRNKTALWQMIKS